MDNNTAFIVLAYLTNTLAESEYNHPIIKKLDEILPLVETKKDYITALLLNDDISVTNFRQVRKLVDSRYFVEEELLLTDFLNIFEEVANVSGAAVSTDTPKISIDAAEKYKRRYPTFDVNSKLFNTVSGKSSGRTILGGINLESYDDKMLYNYITNNPNKPYVIKNLNSVKLLNTNI